MKTSAVLTPLALVAVGLQPVSADIGRGAGLVIDLFGQGIAELFVEIFSKRDAANVIVRRQVPGVPEFEYQRCREDIAGLTITATSPAPNSVQFTGVPPTCMNLAGVLVGDEPGPYALPCGSDCLIYEDLTPEQFDELVSVLQSV
ncbi:hypothetical protein D7B24_005441 [Verticillium nonalfalfae]|uniref:Predicted protein n=2 Tax=Verticillium TaxID=1036719 RepID=C9SDD6_VERA1|nr:predicted protein [Verticillium alfalfae VaMs.102]XP_028496115.1 uncharacterized protein D7B24_005441 [Verticillium nonalfalfae]EEY17088.1 predicted protein [Verticillium alfalfae VaMs.102]RNJ57957.1 hypothetical protein D7B24_005441 [Verticillium nonalfalfae]